MTRCQTHFLSSFFFFFFNDPPPPETSPFPLPAPLPFGPPGPVAGPAPPSHFPPRALRPATIGAAGSGAAGAPATVLTTDGKTLVTAGSSGLVWIDTSTLKPKMDALTEWRISSLGLSPDGGTLFAVNDGGQVAEISMSSGAVAGRFDPSAGTVIALMRVASA